MHVLDQLRPSRVRLRGPFIGGHESLARPGNHRQSLIRVLFQINKSGRDLGLFRLHVLIPFYSGSIRGGIELPVGALPVMPYPQTPAPSQMVNHDLMTLLRR